MNPSITDLDQSRIPMMLAMLFLSVALWSGCSQGEEHEYVRIKTEYGALKVQLYNSTPKHRDNFVKLTKKGFYDGLLFHRVISNFMVQGGDPQSRDAAPGQRLGGGGPGYKLPAEIGNYHYRGTLAAARDQNPEKRSSGSQFYIIQGRKVNDAMLDRVEKANNITYPDSVRQRYKEIGGYPSLDGKYTVFGRVVEGVKAVDQMANQPTGQNNRPKEDISMQIEYLGKE